MEEKKKVPADIAGVAARWWADRLRADVYPSVLKQAGWTDRPDGYVDTIEKAKVVEEDRFRGAAVDGLMGLLLASKEKLTAEEVDRFEAKLAEAIVAEERYGSKLTIGVDYGPDDIFVRALEAAEIDIGRTGAAGRFPLKTTMWIDDEEVKVSAGYRGSPEALFTSKRRVIRDAIIEREWPVQEPWYVEERKVVEPLCKAREEVYARVKSYDHPEYVAVHAKVLEAMEPGGRRREYWTRTRDMILGSLPLMPPGKLKTIIEDIWSAIVVADEAYMMNVKESAA